MCFVSAGWLLSVLVYLVMLVLLVLLVVRISVYFFGRYSSSVDSCSECILALIEIIVCLCVMVYGPIYPMMNGYPFCTASHRCIQWAGSPTETNPDQRPDKLAQLSPNRSISPAPPRVFNHHHQCSEIFNFSVHFDFSTADGMMVSSPINV